MLHCKQNVLYFRFHDCIIHILALLVLFFCQLFIISCAASLNQTHSLTPSFLDYSLHLQFLFLELSFIYIFRADPESPSKLLARLSVSAKKSPPTRAKPNIQDGGTTDHEATFDDDDGFEEAFSQLNERYCGNAYIHMYYGYSLLFEYVSVNILFNIKKKSK